MLRSKHTSVQKQLITTQQELDKTSTSLAEVRPTKWLACCLLYDARCVQHSGYPRMTGALSCAHGEAPALDLLLRGCGAVRAAYVWPS